MEAVTVWVHHRFGCESVLVDCLYSIEVYCRNMCVLGLMESTKQRAIRLEMSNSCWKSKLFSDWLLVEPLQSSCSLYGSSRSCRNIAQSVWFHISMTTFSTAMIHCCRKGCHRYVEPYYSQLAPCLVAICVGFSGY